MAATPSFDDWIARFRAGDADAATAVFTRFATRLIGLARCRLDARVRQKEDPDDVVQSVYRSFFLRDREQPFRLEDWAGLWALLVCMTVRKCANRQHHYHRQVRDVRRETAILDGDGGVAEEWRMLGAEPSHEHGVEFIDFVVALMRGLKERDRRITALYLQGHTKVEIAALVGLSKRMVELTMHQVARRAGRMAGVDLGDGSP